MAWDPYGRRRLTACPSWRERGPPRAGPRRRAGPGRAGRPGAGAPRGAGGARRPARAAGRALEQALGDVMAVLAVEGLEMQRHAGVHRERLEELAHQLGVEGAD